MGLGVRGGTSGDDSLGKSVESGKWRGPYVVVPGIIVRREIWASSTRRRGVLTLHTKPTGPSSDSPRGRSSNPDTSAVQLRMIPGEAKDTPDREGAGHDKGNPGPRWGQRRFAQHDDANANRDEWINDREARDDKVGWTG